MWTTPEKHTKKRETLRNAKQHKTTRRAGYKKEYAKKTKTKKQRKHSELKEHCEMVDNTKNTNNSQTEEGQSPKMNQSN